VGGVTRRRQRHFRQREGFDSRRAMSSGSSPARVSHMGSVSSRSGLDACCSDCAVEQIAAAGIEDASEEERVELCRRSRLRGSQKLPAAGVAVGDASLLRFAHAADVATAGLAVHPSAASAVEQALNQSSRPTEGSWTRSRGLDPFLDGVGTVAERLATSAVPHHVSGVLGLVRMSCTFEAASMSRNVFLTPLARLEGTGYGKCRARQP